MFEIYNCLMDYPANNVNSEINMALLEMNLEIEIVDLSRKLDNINRMKHAYGPGETFSPCAQEQHYLALGLHNTTEFILKKIDPLTTQPDYIQFLEGYHKSLQELKIKFLLQSIIENPVNWEDFELSCGIYDDILCYYQSARRTLSQTDLACRHIALSNIQQFLAVFKYNFSYNLIYKNIRPPVNKNYLHYYSLVRNLAALRLDENLCHKIAKIRNAIRICQDSFRESNTQGEEYDPLLMLLKQREQHYIDFCNSHGIAIGTGY